MLIQLDNNWRLKAVKDGWDLERYRPLTKGPRAGEETWAVESHHDTINWALHAAWRGMVHEGVGVANLDQVLMRVNEVESRLLEIAAAHLPPVQATPARRSDIQEIIRNPWGKTG